MAAKNRKRGNYTRMIVVGAALLAAALGGGGCWYYSAAREVDPASLYQTAPVAYGEVNQTITGEAHVRTTGTTSLFIERPQTVSAVHVEVGDRVHAGQVLVEYDIAGDTAELNRRLSESDLYLANANLNMENLTLPPSGNQLLQYETAVLTAEKSVSDAKFEMESLESKLRAQRVRVGNLREISGLYKDDYEDDVIGEEEYDTARANYRVAQADLDDLATQLEAKAVSLETYEKLLDTAKQKLRNAQDPMADSATAARYAIQKNLASIQFLSAADIRADLGKLTAQTTSPIDGSVLSVHVVEGGTAGSAGAVLVLSDKGKAVVRFEVSEFDAPQVKLGQRAGITAGGVQGKVYAGKVTKISEDAVEKETSGDNEIVVPIEITLENIDDDLKVGYTVQVVLLIGQRQGVLHVPLQSMFMEQDAGYVYVISDGQVVRRQITTGFSGDKSVEVLDGLQEDDLLILNPQEV